MRNEQCTAGDVDTCSFHAEHDGNKYSVTYEGARSPYLLIAIICSSVRRRMRMANDRRTLWPLGVTSMTVVVCKGKLESVIVIHRYIYHFFVFTIGL